MKEQIKIVRKTNGLNQEEFGKRLGISGAAVSRIESGERSASEPVIRAICSQFGINRHWLETGEGEMIDPQIDSDIELLTRAMEGQSEAKKNLLRIVAGMPEELLDKIIEYLNSFKNTP